MHVNEHEKLSNNTLKWDSPYGMQRFEELPFKIKEEVCMQCFVRDQQIDEEDKKNVSPKYYDS
jgi:hypothetical protein